MKKSKSSFLKRHSSVIAIAVIAVLAVSVVYFAMRSPIVNQIFPSGESNSTSNYYYGNGDSVPTSPPNSPLPLFLLPTSLTVQVSPNPVVVGHAVYGSVTSNGYNTPVSITVRNLGAMEWMDSGSQTIEAFLGADGKYEHVQQLNTAGFWEVVAETNGVSSNVASLTCTGINVFSSKSSVGSDGYYAIFTVLSSYRNAQVNLIANNPVHMISVPLQTVNTDGNGAVSVMYNFSSFSPGSYEIDALIGGDKASNYGMSFWITVN